MLLGAVAFAMSMVVLVVEEKVLVQAVNRKRNSRGSETGKSALESVPPRKRTLISPRLAKSNHVSLLKSSPMHPNSRKLDSDYGSLKP